MGTQTLKSFFEDSLRIEGYEPTMDRIQCMINSYNVLISKKELDLKMLIESHKRLVVFQDNADDLVGIRKCNVKVGNDIKMDFEKVPGELVRWIYAFNNNSCFSKMLHADYEIILIANGFHLKFEEIHPFRDGNGRIGRQLWLLFLAKNLKIDWLKNIIIHDSLTKEVPWFLQYAYYNNFRYIKGVNYEKD